MLINSQGYGHFKDSLNNQDFGIETSRMALVLDGCSGAKYSEVGTRLFAQLFSKKEECDNVEKFEDNVKSIFDGIIEMMRKHYTTQEELENEFILENLLFTIIACFETEDKFIVKMFGDGYIVTENVHECISYMKFNYGKCPPYYAYRYCELLPDAEAFKGYDFKTFEFDKKKFKKVAIATDGIQPFAKGSVGSVDGAIRNGNLAEIKLAIMTNASKFYDDTTLAIVGGKK